MDYRTLKGIGTAELVIKKSVFIGYASPAETEDEAREFIAKIKAHHSDATHNVSAYLINDGKNFAVRYDDDGEPKGSAGKPVLKVIQNRGLSNVVVVVTRYFGGIKLGYGGLVKAYSDTASLAIENAGIIEVYETERFQVTFPYSLFHTVRETVEKAGGGVVKEDYGELVTFTVETRKGEAEKLMELLTERTRGRVRLRRLFMSSFEGSL
ncbi:thymidylate synthase [Thermococcus celericrescens]|uniref:Thymidylate synthase n=1 Tax=Thermococcus celericrescens TaxID=227598 RepID=A0A100XYI1_9EURY|nr:YigZ family protein [Thermococcus celericrescens]KUH33933.1 thymidylate synthase [Thermococcus celericrescens]